MISSEQARVMTEKSIEESLRIVEENIRKAINDGKNGCSINKSEIPFGAIEHLKTLGYKIRFSRDYKNYIIRW